MNDKQVKDFQTGKTIALWLGGAVYVGVVLLFLAFFQNLMAEQFTGFLKLVARIGAVLVALNALALPVALHYWTVTPGHKFVAVVFYALDIILMALNTLAAANMHNGAIPEWLQNYTEYAPASVVFTLFGWAVLYMTDPGQRALINLTEAITSAQVTIVKRAAEFVKSDEGMDSVIVPFAAKLAAKVFNERGMIGTSRALPVTPEVTPNDLGIDEVVRRVVEQMSRGVSVTPQVTPSNTMHLSEYALPCGHTQGATMNDDKTGYVCAVCRKPFTLDDLGKQNKAEPQEVGQPVPFPGNGLKK